MSWFRNQKISRKMYMLLFVTLISLVGMGIFNLSRMHKVFDAANYSAINSVPSILVLHRVITAIDDLTEHTYQHVLTTDETTMAGVDKQIRKDREDFEKAMKDYEPLISDDKDKQMLADDRAAMNELAVVRDKVFALSRDNKKIEARDMILHDAKPLTEKLAKRLDSHMEYNVTLSEKGTKDAAVVNKQATIISLCIILLVGVVVVVLTIAISQTITCPIGICVDVANRLAEGDLTVAVDVRSEDETGQLMAAMKNMVQNLRDMITRTVDISTSIASASNELHSTSAQIATGAEEVAAQTNTVATASEEMSATSTDIARNCSMVADASRLTTDSANAGAKVVQETISGMNVIADRVRQTSKTIETLGVRSDQIGAIISTIEDIADQTNLLALNAAIEAARAGEQGRGFAVVADEVRALAERTTRATREIGEMIKAIQNETREAVKAMEEGVHEVEKGAVSSLKSGQALEDILERINEVAMQVNQIATAAEEQTATTGEVTNNIQQITEVVQQTARGADETAGAAAQLATQAQELQNLVRRFRLS